MRKFFFFILIGLCVLMLPWGIISLSTLHTTYQDIQKIPPSEYGLLLGTTPGTNGSNLFFTTRIEATKELYERGKIKKIIVSGDNANENYNEPLYMKKALLNANIPEKDIIMDYAGFRTLDSVIRARKVFSLTGTFTIISQPFHIERAIYLAEANGIDAIGYGAADVSLEYGLYAYLREIPARWLALYDAWFGTEATVLGKKEEIGVN